MVWVLHQPPYPELSLHTSLISVHSWLAWCAQGAESGWPCSTKTSLTGKYGGETGTLSPGVREPNQGRTKALLATEGLCQDVCPLIIVKVPEWRGMSEWESDYSVTEDTYRTHVADIDAPQRANERREKLTWLSIKMSIKSLPFMKSAYHLRLLTMCKELLSRNVGQINDGLSLFHYSTKFYDCRALWSLTQQSFAYHLKHSRDICNLELINRSKPVFLHYVHYCPSKELFQKFYS